MLSGPRFDAPERAMLLLKYADGHVEVVSLDNMTSLAVNLTVDGWHSLPRWELSIEGIGDLRWRQQGASTADGQTTEQVQEQVAPFLPKRLAAGE